MHWDIVGQSGCDVLERELPPLVFDRGIDFIVANIENAASGFGFNYKNLSPIKKGVNVDAFTTGNHVYAKREVIDRFDDFDGVLAHIIFQRPSRDW